MACLVRSINDAAGILRVQRPPQYEFSPAPGSDRTATNLDPRNRLSNPPPFVRDLQPPTHTLRNVFFVRQNDTTRLFDVLTGQLFLFPHHLPCNLNFSLPLFRIQKTTFPNLSKRLCTRVQRPSFQDTRIIIAIILGLVEQSDIKMIVKEIKFEKNIPVKFQIFNISKEEVKRKRN